MSKGQLAQAQALPSRPSQAVEIECTDPACACSSAQRRRHRGQMKNNTVGKYANQGGGWVVCGDTADTLPPDMYKTERGPFSTIMRPIDLKTDNPVDIPGSTSERIAREISSFWKLGDKFKEVGMLHKRGILLFGPAGAGKTSTACAIARKVIAENGIVFVLVNGDFDTMKQAIGEVRQREPNRPILNIIEDIDELVENGQEENLLAFLDGEDQIDHVANIGTTNNLEKMGVRLINRPSRFDLVVEVGMPSELERHTYFKAKVGDTLEATQWAKETEGMSLAHLRELIVGTQCMGESADAVLKRLRAMMVKPVVSNAN